MTREEAKGRLLDIQNRLNMTFRTVQEQEEYTALEMAIKALQDKGHDRKKAKRFKNKYLKLKTAIDKIRAEIQKALDEDKATDTENAKVQAIALMWCLEIIDKYKAESEE